ncbi:MAG: bifunctional sugar phosphate isomerase/epimerase/4-hydroxyphenylpyruvate dioxygenase family protein [Paracoccaceae bacterium]
MKTGIATVSIAGDFATKLGAIAAAGFDGIEIFEQDFLASDLSPRAAGQMVRDHGLEVLLFQPFRDFEGLPAPLRARAFTRARRKFALMNELGTDLMLICSSVHPQALGGIDRAADDLAELGAIAAEYGVRVGYEALAWGRHVDDHRDAWEIVRRADHPHIGLILDSYHTLARGIDPESIRRIPGEKIFFVQLADAPAIRMDLLYLSRHFRSMPGEGDLDVPAFMRAVMATGYDGPLSLEVFNDQFRAGLPRLVALDGHRALINLMDGLRRAAPELSVDLPAMPAPAPVERVEFIEFVTSPGEAPRIEALLQSLGFRLTGQHVSKSVRRFQQNGVNILINTEQQGYAHAAFLSHGTCVSEIAVVVPDARQTFARGKALLAEPFGDGPNPGELDIPALRGVGGSLLRLLDDHSDLAHLWEVDFTPLAPTDTGAGLMAVDHISQTMPFDEMLSWTQFYTAIFKGHKAPMVDVADPEGLVRSQAVKSGALRVTLNGAEARRTLATRFLADSFGAATQHIAFACEDIFATARILSDKGFDVLPIGANYYDDLDARYDLPADLLEHLKAGHILFDQDEDGQFFQLYSRPFGDGLFIEIIQRTGRYDGYGAPNAPFRIAAQARLGTPVTIPKR